MKIYKGRLERMDRPENVKSKVMEVFDFVKSKYRCPRAGEYFLSGATPSVYHTNNDLSTKYWVMVPYHKSEEKEMVGSLESELCGVCSKYATDKAYTKGMVLKAIDQLRAKVGNL